MEKFISDVLKITPDELMGLMRSYACWHIENVTTLGSLAVDNLQGALKQFPTSAGPIIEKKKTQNVAPLSSAVTPLTTGKTLVVAGLSTAVTPYTGTVDPFPIVVPSPPLGSNTRKSATSAYVSNILATVCSLVSEHSDTVAEEVSNGKEPKQRWQRLLPFLAKAGVCITNYPVRATLPGFEEKKLAQGNDKKTAQGQGVKGLSADELKVLASAIAAPGGQLELHRANPTSQSSSLEPVIVTAPPILTPAEKVEADQGKKAGLKPLWPYPSGVRLFADGRFDYEGPAAILKDASKPDAGSKSSAIDAIIVPDDDDDDDDIFQDSSRGHKRSTSSSTNDVPLKKAKFLPSAQMSTTARTDSSQPIQEKQKPQASDKLAAPAPVVPEIRVGLATPKTAAPKIATGPPAPPSTFSSMPGIIAPSTASSVPTPTTTPSPGTTPSASTNVFASTKDIQAPVVLGAGLPDTSSTPSASLTPNTSTASNSMMPTTSLTLGASPTGTSSLFDGSSTSNAFTTLENTHVNPTAAGVDEMEFAFLDTSLERSATSQVPSFIHRDAQPSFHQGNHPQMAPNDVMGLFQVFLQQHANGTTSQQHASGTMSQLASGPDQSALIAYLQHQLQQQAQQLGAYQAQGSGQHTNGISISQQPSQLGGPGVGFPGQPFGGQGTYFGGGNQGF
ncbi:hypothetical protein BKA70DRAFT_1442050 [Coprinopsis sp. MPI-PUGE-AT-0042]|nr:hypothetical protein BKA70DRAFT_1442050 [Coprinopsis sp. MPI-PUGE-AT-0042]